DKSSLAWMFQHHTDRTSEVIFFLMIFKRRGIKLWSHSCLPLSRPLFVLLSQAADKFNPLSRHRYDVLSASIPTIAHHLLRLVAKILFHPFYAARQFGIIVAILTDSYSNNHLMTGLGAELHIVTGRVTAIRLLHHSRLRIAGAGSGCCLVLGVVLGHSNLLHSSSDCSRRCYRSRAALSRAAC